MEVLDDSYTSSESVLKFSPLWRRVIAAFVDLIVVVVVTFGIIAATSYVLFTFGGREFRDNYRSDVDRNVFLARAFALTLFLILSFFYLAILESSWKQGTLGKILVGIRVGKSNGQKISFLNAGGRNIIKILSGPILFIGFVVAIFHSKKQSFHDMLAKTFVYRR